MRVGVAICGLLPPSLQIVLRTKPGSARKRTAERQHVVHVCKNDRERRKRERLKYNTPGLIYALRLLGPSLQTEYIHCAYSNFALQNDLHLSYLRSSGIVQGGSRPCSSKSFGSDALLVAAHSLG